MPPAVAALAAAAAASATAAGATAATAAIVSTAVTVGANLAISVGLTLAANMLMGGKRPPKPSEGVTEHQQPVPPRFWHYGRVKISGPYAFYEDLQSAGHAGKIVILSSREIDAVQDSYLDDRDISLGAYGTFGYLNVINRYLDGSIEKAGVHHYEGTDTQTVALPITDVWPSNVWSTDHRLRGIAYSVIIVADIEDGALQIKVFPNGFPSFKALIRASLLYDPRLDSTTGGSGSHLHADKSTWEWEENAGLAVLDYLTHEDGYDIDIAEIDLPSFRAFADVCDEAVTLKAGGTEPRWRIATTVYMNEPRTNVLARLLDACDAQLYPTSDGLIGIRGGEWAAPTVTITDDHILEFEHQGGPATMERYNEIAFQYRSPDHGYTEVEGDPWRNEADITDTGQVLTRPFDVAYIPSHGQARRRQKIRMARDNPANILQIKTNFYGLNAIGERTITVQLSELEIDEPMWVEDIAILEDGTGVTMKLRSASEDSYDWVAVDEEGTAPTIPEDA